MNYQVHLDWHGCVKSNPAKSTMIKIKPKQLEYQFSLSLVYLLVYIYSLPLFHCTVYSHGNSLLQQELCCVCIYNMYIQCIQCVEQTINPVNLSNRNSYIYFFYKLFYTKLIGDTCTCKFSFPYFTFFHFQLFFSFLLFSLPFSLPLSSFPVFLPFHFSSISI